MSVQGAPAPADLGRRPGFAGHAAQAAQRTRHAERRVPFSLKGARLFPSGQRGFSHRVFPLHLFKASASSLLPLSAVVPASSVLPRRKCRQPDDTHECSAPCASRPLTGQRKSGVALLSGMFQRKSSGLRRTRAAPVMRQSRESTSAAMRESRIRRRNTNTGFQRMSSLRKKTAAFSTMSR